MSDFNNTPINSDLNDGEGGKNNGPPVNDSNLIILYFTLGLIILGLFIWIIVISLAGDDAPAIIAAMIDSKLQSMAADDSKPLS